ncbi:MAG: hypothetical protein FWD71_10245 [Oscillospiraceae bacterium]|nr:hypothetical protein [Oscillospiraceae bacterium]
MADVSSVNSASGVNAQYKYSTTQSSSTNGMSMQDFLTLVVAQMQNQDINSSGQDNNQFMAQMAQMASMQAMQELTAAFMSSMTMSYMGKYVKAEAVTDDGTKTSAEGVVDRINFNGGDAFVLVGNTWFKTQDIYEVGDVSSADSASANAAANTVTNDDANTAVSINGTDVTDSTGDTTDSTGLT